MKGGRIGEGRGLGAAALLTALPPKSSLHAQIACLSPQLSSLPHIRPSTCRSLPCQPESSGGDSGKFPLPVCSCGFCRPCQPCALRSSLLWAPQVKEEQTGRAGGVARSCHAATEPDRGWILVGRGGVGCREPKSKQGWGILWFH